MPINRWFNKETAPTWGVAAVRRRLEPEWSEGQSVDERWTLVEISAISSVVVVSFRRRLDDTIARVHLRVRDDQRPAYLRTDNVDLWYVPGKGEDGDAARELVERCAERLRARGDDERYRLATREASAPEAFNLALASPCAQQCAFCSLKTTGLVGPQPQDVERLKRRLSESARSGAHILRVNGIEPLRSPYLFELLAHARDVGFRQYDVFSTCRPLADADFAARFLAAISPRYRIYIPTGHAATHDAFTGSRAPSTS